MTAPLDLRPLTEPIDPSAYREFLRGPAAQYRTGGGFAGCLIAVVAVLLVGSGLSVSVSVNEHSLGGGALLALLAAGAAIGVGAWLLQRRAQDRRNHRLHRFTLVNGLVYRPDGPADLQPGLIFALGRDRSRQGRIFDPQGPTGARAGLDAGTQRYVTGSGRSRQVHHWSYVAFRLPRRVPHMLLDAKDNNSLFGSNLPVGFSREQRLSLEGDFDRWFTLYCPRQYERDALYVFTPDLMARMIDYGSAYDIELVDDYCYLYRKGVQDLLDPGFWLHMQQMMSQIGERTRQRTLRYADDRIGDPAMNLIAPGGQRLRQGVPWAAIAIGVLIVAGYLVLRLLLDG